MTIKLKPDSWVKRKYNPKMKEQPKSPLTDKQKKYLLETCWEKCYKAYRNRMMASALVSDFESQEDLQGEAWIAMNEILDRFDISKCGKIAKYDEPGDDKPKTLEFYFLNYFYGRVNFIACESRSHKKSRNIIGNSNSEINEYDYNPAQDFTGVGANQEYEITGHIHNKLLNKSIELQRFFVQVYVQQCSYKELVDEYGQDTCKKLKSELTKFITSIKKRHTSDFKVNSVKKNKKIK